MVSVETQAQDQVDLVELLSYIHQLIHIMPVVVQDHHSLQMEQQVKDLVMVMAV
mgnify:CR=1 FL=1